MKQKILLYLFIFSVLIIIFQYVNSKKIIDTYEKDFTALKAKVKTQDNQIATLNDENLDLMAFNIESDDEALTYFENKGYKVEPLLAFIKDKLLESNLYQGDDHPIIPYASTTSNKISINTIRILNHKWIIANFTDGKYWGQILLKYDVSGQDQVAFKVLDYFLYLPS